MNNELLYNTILKVLQKEDRELTGTGIFYAPELYIAFITGKQIKEKEMKLFGKSVK